MSLKEVFDFRPRIERLPTDKNPISNRCSVLANKEAAIEDLKNMYRLNHFSKTRQEYDHLCWSDRIGVKRAGILLSYFASDGICEILDVATGPFKALFHAGCAAYFAIRSKLNPL